MQTYLITLSTICIFFNNIFILILILMNSGILPSPFFSPHVQNTSQDTAEELFNDKEPSLYEVERLEREEAFDTRIEKLKQELAEQNIAVHTGTIADELHPLVHNLPHDSIKTKYDAEPSVEVAE